MNRIDLIPQIFDVKIGQRCHITEPNIIESTIFYEDGEPIGLYLKEMPDKMKKLADLANAEFLSNNVPKSLLERSDVFQKVYKQGMTRKEAKGTGTIQMSTILGAIPPKPHMRRPYPSISAVHSSASAQTYIKAMYLLAIESENIIQKLLPNIYEQQLQLFEDIKQKWKFTNLFTSSIANFNISAPYHRDTANIEGAVNVIITKRRNSKGGCLNIPEYGATIEQCDNSLLVYPAWKSIHGVTDINLTHKDGYRNSLVFYPLKAFKGID